MAKANSAFMKPLNLSAELAEVVGNGPMPRSEVISKLWEYIKGDDYENDNGKKGSSLRKGPNLQDPKDKRMINTDEKLQKVFGQAQVHMMKMGGLLKNHLS